MDEATTAGAIGRVPTPADVLALRWAASALLYADLEMDEATTAVAQKAAAVIASSILTPPAAG